MPGKKLLCLALAALLALSVLPAVFAAETSSTEPSAATAPTEAATLPAGTEDCA